jgi:hypothetical protein
MADQNGAESEGIGPGGLGNGMLYGRFGSWFAVGTPAVLCASDRYSLIITEITERRMGQRQQTLAHLLSISTSRLLIPTAAALQASPLYDEVLRIYHTLGGVLWY